MASLFITEKGFGRGNRGKAVVVANKYGKPLKLQFGELQNGAVGGRALIIHNEPINQKWYRTHMVIDGPVFEVTVERCGDKGGNILIRKFDIDINNNRHLTVTEMSTGYFVNKDKSLKYISASDMVGCEDAQKLIETKLFEAFLAAVERSYCFRPNKIFFGSIATDAPFFKKEWTQQAAEVQEEAASVEA